MKSFLTYLLTENAPPMDPQVLAELDSLRAMRINLENDNYGFRSQIGTQQEEISKLQMTLTQRNSELDEVRSSLKGALDKNKKLSDNLNSMEKKNSSSSGQFEVSIISRVTTISKISK